ncbi:winged helix-turn-helix domain-containing protein [Klebsiella huaxiensis]|uniref:winged helix-turn-helix domain-containing protein n=1 Tax=Klebsiella huaxiensis TaxID=2153354 RepID=UPI002F312D28
MSCRYQLNDFIEFNPESNTLKMIDNHLVVITINQPVARCLELLLERRYEMVLQKDFYPYVWGEHGKAVSINTLYQNISLLRKAFKTFGEKGNNFVITHSKKGFSLSPTVSVKKIGLSQRVGYMKQPDKVLSVHHYDLSKGDDVNESCLLKASPGSKTKLIIMIMLLIIVFIEQRPINARSIYSHRFANYSHICTQLPSVVCRNRVVFQENNIRPNQRVWSVFRTNGSHIRHTYVPLYRRIDKLLC